MRRYLALFLLMGALLASEAAAQATGLLVAGSGNSGFFFARGLGADFRLSPRFDARISAGLGDLEGVSLSAVWVH